MKYRKLKNGQKVADATESVAMTIDSICPRKWAFIDMETGDIWVHASRIGCNKRLFNVFYAADSKAIDAIKSILFDRV